MRRIAARSNLPPRDRGGWLDSACPGPSPEWAAALLSDEERSLHPSHLHAYQTCSQVSVCEDQSQDLMAIRPKQVSANQDANSKACSLKS